MKKVILITTLVLGLFTSYSQNGCCETYNVTNPVLPLISNAYETVSMINIPLIGTVTDINVTNVSGTHDNIHDLQFKLMSPIGTQVILLTPMCDGSEDFNISFDDEAMNLYSSIPCSPTDGLTYQPNSPLSNFNGEQAEGTWGIIIYDNSVADSGLLTSWTLEICVGDSTYVTTHICNGQSYTFPDGSIGTSTQTNFTTLLNENGCDSVIVTNLDVTTINTNIIDNGLELSSSAVNIDTYRWVECSDISIVLGTQQSFYPIETGDYAVLITDSGCINISDCIPFGFTSVDEGIDFENSISLFPNPVVDIITVKWSGDISEIVITDVEGRVINRIYNDLNDETYNFDLTNFNSGIYLITIIGESSNYTKRIIKQ